MINDYENFSVREQRERRIRATLMRVLHASLSNQHGGWVTGRYLLDVLQSGLAMGDVPDDESHLLQLLRELAGKGFVAEEDNREDERQPFGIDYLTFRITGQGCAYQNRSLPADPDIADGRVIKR